MTRLRKMRQRNENWILERDGDSSVFCSIEMEDMYSTTHLEEDKYIYIYVYM
jgi:hypothetical protein